MKKKAKRIARGDGPLTPGIPNRCAYEKKPFLIFNLAGYSPVWIPNAEYDLLAKSVQRRTKSEEVKRMLRRRAAPLGVVTACAGTCGGTCKDTQLPGGAFMCLCKSNA